MRSSQAVVVAPGIGGREWMALRVVRRRADEVLEAGIDERVDGLREPELRQRLGLARARAETGTPEQPFGLRHIETPPVHRHPHPFTVGKPGGSPDPPE
jgi:hypothetical protein